MTTIDDLEANAERRAAALRKVRLPREYVFAPGTIRLERVAITQQELAVRMAAQSTSEVTS